MCFDNSYHLRKTAVESVAKTVNSMTEPSSDSDCSIVPSEGVSGSDENIAINSNGNIEGSMKIWRFFSNDERILLSDTFKR